MASTPQTNLTYTWRLLIAILLLHCTAQAAQAADTKTITAVTKPSKDVVMSFRRPGQIAAVNVKIGQHIRAGEPVASIDARLMEARLSQLKAQADNKINVLIATAQLAEKKTSLERIVKARRHGASNTAELDRAKLDVLIADLSLAAANLEHEQNIRKYDEARIQLDQHTLKSPVDGTVEFVAVEAGESVDTVAPVVRIVTIDPLWIDAMVPLTQGEKLKRGDIAMVSFRHKQAKPNKGRIINVSSMADPGSGTVNVRIELPNPTKRIAGDRAYIVFQPHQAATTQPKSKVKTTVSPVQR